MRYESIPRKIINGISSAFKTLRQEFGNWAFVIIGFILLLFYKPAINFWNAFSEAITYVFLGALALGVLYWIIKKIFR